MTLFLRRFRAQRAGPGRNSLLIGDAAVRAALPVIEALRQGEPSGADPITSVDWFLSRTAAWRNTPIAVILQRGGRPAAAALFSAERRLGLLTGLVRGGNGSGDGLLVAAADRERTATAAIDVVLGIPWVHSVVASLRGGQPAHLTPTLLSGADCRWMQREVGTDLSLEGGYEGFLSRLGRRSRRNYRYYRRRAEAELGLSFVPELRPEEAAAAVAQLHAVSLHPVPRARSVLIDEAIRQTPGSFAMGLRLPGGRWVSYLAGWRQAGTTFVERQFNDHREQDASLSTVMRACMIEHEAARQVGRLVFVGGTSAALGRYCAVDHCLDLLVTRRDFRGQVGRMLMTRLSPQGQVATMMRATA